MAWCNRKRSSLPSSTGSAIEVATLNSDSPTLICGLPVSFADEFQSATPLRVGLLGAGTVGLGVYRTLAAHPETFDIRRVAVRRLEREDEIPADSAHSRPLGGRRFGLRSDHRVDRRSVAGEGID